MSAVIDTGLEPVAFVGTEQHPWSSYLGRVRVLAWSAEGMDDPQPLFLRPSEPIGYMWAGCFIPANEAHQHHKSEGRALVYAEQSRPLAGETR